MLSNRRDEGQILLLLITYCALGVALVFVAIDAAEVFLAQRSLASLADGAALAASQSVDRSAYYTGAMTQCRLPLSAAGATATVDAYLTQPDSGAPATVAREISVDPATSTVTVVLTRRVQLPLQGLLGAIEARWAGGVPVSATASARAPFLAATGSGAGC